MKKKSGFSKILGAKGAGTVVTAFIGLIIIYIAFGILNPKVFSLLNIQNLLRSMSKYLLIGIGQSFVMITGNVDLSIGSVVGMSAMISATMMTKGMNPVVAIIVTIVLALVVGVVNGYLVGKFKLPPFIATLGTMFIARGIAYIVNNTETLTTLHPESVKKPETDSRIFSTMERQQEFLIHSGSHLLFSLSSGFSLQEPDPDVTFMQSVLT